MTTRLAATLAVALAALPAATRAAPARWVQGEVIVKFKDGTSPGRAAAAVAAHAHVQLPGAAAGWSHVRLRPGESVEEALATYAEDPDVAWAQPNYVYRAFAAPSAGNTLYPQQWALHNAGPSTIVGNAYLQPDAWICPDAAGGSCPSAANPGTSGDDIGAEAAWDVVNDCSAVVVAVVDTGVNYNHQDLAPNMWNDPNGVYTRHGVDCVTTQDCLTGDGDPMDENGHGTHVAGIIGANGIDSVGAVGVCWTASIMAVRALDATGTGSSVSIASGIDFARTHGARVVNLSLGFPGPDDPLVANAVASAISAGTVVVAAAGNDGASNDAHPVFPCDDANVLCVGALDQAFRLADFSNYSTTYVDVGAPGVNVLSSWPGTHAITAQDDLTAGWTYPTAGWGTNQYSTSLGTVTLLSDPSPWGAGHTYATTADHRVYKPGFDTSAADVVTIGVYASLNVSAGDTFRLACRTGGGDPFAAGGVVVEQDSGVQTGNAFPFGEANVSACKDVNTSVGFQLQSAAPSSLVDYGVAFWPPLEVKKLSWNANSYNVEHGTSMASPVVAGVAALLLAFQPAFTPADVTGAILGGGTTPAGNPLATKIRSGKAVSAIGALRYVNPPRGLTYTVQ